MQQPERLVLISAHWGPRGHAKRDVLEKLKHHIRENGDGCFLHFATLQEKFAVLGHHKGDRLDLCLKWKIGDDTLHEETFGDKREVLIGDVVAYYAKLLHQRNPTPPVPDDLQDTLLHRFRPILLLHGCEQSFPCRVEWYLPQCSLYLRFKDQRIKVVDSITNPQEQLNTFYVHHSRRFHTNETNRFFMRHNNGHKMRGGEKDQINQVPFYGRAYHTASGEICLTYFFFYAYNGAVMQSSVVPNFITKKAGIHEGDWEHISVLVDREFTIRGVYMSRHGKESRWYHTPATSKQKDDGWHTDERETDRVVIYCARESHANYNLPGNQYRGYGGFIDDSCGGGLTWSPDLVVNLGSPTQPRVPWLYFAGRWGKLSEEKLANDGPTGPFLKGCYWAPPKTKAG